MKKVARSFGLLFFKLLIITLTVGVSLSTKKWKLFPSLVVRDAMAYIDPYCASPEYTYPTGIGYEVIYSSEARFGNDSVVLARYFFDGYSWQPATEHRMIGVTNGFADEISFRKTYTETKDFAHSALWYYRRPGNVISSIRCNNYVRAYNIEWIDSPGAITIAAGESKEVTIKASHQYVGLVFGPAETLFPDAFRGNNNGFSPNSPWSIRALSSSWSKEGGLGVTGEWSQSLGIYDLTAYDPSNPENLPTSRVFALSGAEFNPDEGAGASATYEFKELEVLSRDVPGNYCSFPSAPEYPGPIHSNEILNDSGAAERSLTSRWESVPFTSPFSGRISSLSVKVGNYGGAVRRVTCKITESDTRSVVVRGKSGSFSGRQADWRKINIKDRELSLQNGKSYILSCKGSDSWASLYWVWDAAKGLSSGKTYSISVSPTSN